MVNYFKYNMPLKLWTEVLAPLVLKERIQLYSLLRRRLLLNYKTQELSRKSNKSTSIFISLSLVFKQMLEFSLIKLDLNANHIGSNLKMSPQLSTLQNTLHKHSKNIHKKEALDLSVLALSWLDLMEKSRCFSRQNLVAHSHLGKLMLLEEIKRMWESILRSITRKVWIKKQQCS